MKSYFRFLARNPLYTFINVAGLAVSLMFVLLIGDYAWRQLSMDSWHRYADRTYLLGSQNSFYSWPDASRALGNSFPEIESTCCVQGQRGKIKAGQRVYVDKESTCILMADSTFLDFFDFRLKEGDRSTALDAPDKCLITETLARQLFPDGSPLGQSLQVVGKQSVFIQKNRTLDSTLVYTVTGVLCDLDRTLLPNSVKVVVNMDRHAQVLGYRNADNMMSYGPDGGPYTFFRCRPGARLSDKLDEMMAFLERRVTCLSLCGVKQLTLTPLPDVMFAPQNEGLGIQKGDKRQLYILLSAMVAVLFFAVSNYINLTVANAGFRAKEVATCRLLGSTGPQIAGKFMAESIVLIVVSFALGLLLAVAFEQDFQALFRGKIALWQDVSAGSVGLSLAFILVLGVVSGVVPAWQMSRYNPMDIVKGRFRFRSKMVLGRVFLLLQSVVTFVLLVSVFTIHSQLRHLLTAPLGFHTRHVFFIEADRPDVLRDKLQGLPCVERMGCLSGSVPGTRYVSMQTRRDAAGEHRLFFLMDLDWDALDLYGLQLLRENVRTPGAVYLNEEALRSLGLPMEVREVHWGDGSTTPVAGVFRDFYGNGRLAGVRPFLIRIHENGGLERPDFLVRTDGSASAAARLRQAIAEAGCSGEGADRKLLSLEDELAGELKEERNTLHVVLLFAVIAVVVSTLGCVGMSLFFIRQHQKEIGIRKIMGGTSREVTVRMLRLFCMPLLWSFAISVPLSVYLLEDWLQGFSYRISLSPLLWLATAILLLFIAVLSVIVQLFKAVRTNPVESVKIE